MSSQSLIFTGALHLCFVVSERASEIPFCYIMYYFEKVLSSEFYNYGSLADYVIDMSNCETYVLLLVWLVHNIC